MTYAAFGVHRRLVEDEKFDPQSDEYYSELDKRLMAEFPHKLGAKPKTGGSKRLRQPKLPHPAIEVDVNSAINAFKLLLRKS